MREHLKFQFFTNGIVLQVFIVLYFWGVFNMNIFPKDISAFSLNVDNFWNFHCLYSLLNDLWLSTVHENIDMNIKHVIYIYNI